MEAMLRGSKETILLLVSKLLHDSGVNDQQFTKLMYNFMGNAGESSIPVIDVDAGETKAGKEMIKKMKKIENGDNDDKKE